MPITDARNGVTLTAHVGQRGVLLAFDLDDQNASLRQDLAGFAVQGQELSSNGTPVGAAFWLKNLLHFPPFDKNKTWVDSNLAPFQIFHWIHFPQKPEGTIRYTAWPAYFVPGKDPGVAGGLTLRPADARTVEVTLKRRPAPGFELGFTRGFMSSQAYLNFCDREKVTPDIRPKKDPATFPLFDTKTYQGKYEWLGASARTLVEEFMARWQDAAVTLDVFAYDFDEPDVIRAVGAVGKRARVIVDDFVGTTKSKTGVIKKTGHGLPGSAETKAAAWLVKQGCAVKRLHFTRFSHDKVFVLKRNGKAEAVLTGSANFSLRGLYVQSNSIVVIDDAEVAGWYATAFDQAWTNQKAFTHAAIAKQWWAPTTGAAKLPALRISFAPHATPVFSVADVAKRIQQAKGSALFSIMTPTGGGDALKVLTRDMVARNDFLLIGTTENSGGVKTFRAGKSSDTDVVPFAYLKAGTPPPFRAELSGEGGQHIHHKFVVLDFNGANPTVYCGSSNLSSGGEANNGDNLLEINDRAVATAYAVEAIALYDHYRFRSKQQTAKTAKKPITLAVDAAWVTAFYAVGVKALQRRRFILSS